MLRSVSSTKIFLLVVTATFLISVVLGSFALTIIYIPDARTFPILQDLRLLLFRLGNPNQFSIRDDGGLATQVILHYPMGIAEDREGNLLVADRGRWFGLGAIWKISHNGRASLVAGTGHRGAVETGTNALESDLGRPEGLSVDNTNRIYFADSVNHVVIRIENDGQITRIAGTGIPKFSGDGGPAAEASLNLPYDVGLDSQGSVYIADYGNNRIRKVTQDGIIQTMAGTGEPGYSGDGGLATAARLNGPYGIFVDDKDTLLIADTYNHVVRRVNNEGIITTIIGSGRQGYSGDGGPARAASLDGPQAIYVDGSGRTYVGDEHNHAIRVVSPDGLISTLIGTGVAGFNEDGPPRSDAQLNDPEYILVRKDGSLVISEGGNGRILIIEHNGRLRTLAGKR